MRNAAKHFQRLRRLPVTFVAALLMLVGVRPIPGVALAQTPSPDDSAHFTYDTGVSLNVKQVSVKVRDGVTIQDITCTAPTVITVPAYLVIPKGTGKFAGDRQQGRLCWQQEKSRPDWRMYAGC